MPARVQSVKLTIEHVGEPGERMPVVGITLSEGPTDSGKTKTPADLQVLINIGVVIIIYKIMADGITEDSPRDDHQEEANSRSCHRCSGATPGTGRRRQRRFHTGSRMRGQRARPAAQISSEINVTNPPVTRNGVRKRSFTLWSPWSRTTPSKPASTLSTRA